MVQRPAHDTVRLRSRGGLTATALYTPAGGHGRPDSFTFTATDARGLTAAPATVTLGR